MPRVNLAARRSQENACVNKKRDRRIVHWTIIEGAGIDVKAGLRDRHWRTSFNLECQCSDFEILSAGRAGHRGETDQSNFDRRLRGLLLWSRLYRCWALGGRGRWSGRRGCESVSDTNGHSDRFFCVDNPAVPKVSPQDQSRECGHRQKERCARERFQWNTLVPRHADRAGSRDRNSELARHCLSPFHLSQAILELPVERERIARSCVWICRQHLCKQTPDLFRHGAHLVCGQSRRRRLHGHRPFRRHQWRRARSKGTTSCRRANKSPSGNRRRHVGAVPDSRKAKTCRKRPRRHRSLKTSARRPRNAALSPGAIRLQPSGREPALDYSD